AILRQVDPNAVVFARAARARDVVAEGIVLPDVEVERSRVVVEGREPFQRTRNDAEVAVDALLALAERAEPRIPDHGEQAGKIAGDRGVIEIGRPRLVLAIAIREHEAALLFLIRQEV